MKNEKKHPVALLITGLLLVLSTMMLLLSLTVKQVISESVKGTEIVSEMSDRMYSLMFENTVLNSAENNDLKASFQADEHANNAVSMIVDQTLTNLEEGRSYAACDISGELDQAVSDVINQLKENGTLSNQEASMAEQGLKSQTDTISEELNRYAKNVYEGLTAENTPVAKIFSYYRIFVSIGFRIVMLLLILVLMLLTAKLTKKNVNALYLIGAEQIVAGSIVSFVISNALSSIVMELSNSYLKTSVLIERAPFEKAGSYSIILGILLIASAMFAAFKKSATKRQKNKHFDN